MKLKDNLREAIVLSPAWPGEHGGYNLAIKSSLLLYQQIFTSVHFVCISEHPFEDETEWGEPIINWIHIPILYQPKWVRFVKSLMKLHPAITIRYSRATKDILCVVKQIIFKCKENNFEPCIIIEDISTSCFLQNIRRRYPSLRIAVRSHNLLIGAFEGLVRKGFVIERLAWMIEVWKIKRFEKAIVEAADLFWTITCDEAKQYQNELHVSTDGVVGIGMDVERYSHVKQGNSKTIIQIGRVDLRKGKGIHDFIKDVWPSIYDRVPGASLLLAGSGTERFTDKSVNIEGLGFVEDDRSVLDRGMIFINPQRIGAGLQLKSVVAMLAGKTLVSTKVGIEGVEGKHGEHFFTENSSGDMIERIVGLIENTALAERIGQNARALAGRVYSYEYVAHQARPLIEEFVNLEVSKI